jgi:hypothetical protein
MFTMSIQYSLNGYGIKNMVSLHPEVWAQTNGTGTGGGGSSTGGGSGSGGGGSTTGGGGSTTGGGSGSRTGSVNIKTGPSSKVKTHCVIVTKTIRFNSSSSGSSIWNNLSADVRAEVCTFIISGVIGANAGVSANIEALANQLMSTGYITITETTSDYWADKYLCTAQNDQSCNPYDPCTN